MSRSPRGDAGAVGLPASLAGFGAFGPLLVDGFGARVGLKLELRTRELLEQLNRHHPASAAHSLRVAEFTMGMWRAAPKLLGSAETALLGSLLHDIGKLCVPYDILASSRLLTPAERGIMSAHSAEGAAMLLDMGFPETIAAIARGHHERWAGGGYPSGAPAQKLAPIVRAVAVADAFEAMTDPAREYRAPLSRTEALREVAACAGTHFDPEAAAILARSIDQPAQDRAWCAPALSSGEMIAARATTAALH